MNDGAPLNTSKLTIGMMYRNGRDQLSAINLPGKLSFYATDVLLGHLPGADLLFHLTGSLLSPSEHK